MPTRLSQTPVKEAININGKSGKAVENGKYTKLLAALARRCTNLESLTNAELRALYSDVEILRLDVEENETGPHRRGDDERLTAAGREHVDAETRGLRVCSPS